MFELNQSPVASGMIVAPGFAAPRKTTSTTCCRSIARSNACRTFGFCSSGWLFLFGLELMMKSVWSTPGTLETTKSAFSSVLTDVGGSSSIESISPALSADTSASSFENMRSPNVDTFAFGP